MRATLLALLLLLPLVARADEIDRPESGAPTRLTLGPGELGEQPESIPATRLLGQAKATLLIDTPNLFGSIGVFARVHGSYVVHEKVWLSLGIEALEMRDVINASVTQTQLALGPMTTGVHVSALRTKSFSLAPYLRVMWPTSTAYQYARGWGLEVGMSESYEIHPMLSWLAGLMLPLQLTGLGGRTLAVFQPTLATELALHPKRWVDLLVGIELKFGTDPAGAVQYFAPKAAFRFYPVGGFLVELKGMLPVLGVERTHYVFALGLGWIFGQPQPAAASEPATEPASSVPAVPTSAPAPESQPATAVTSMLN
jgi:hypothetical protein